MKKLLTSMIFCCLAVILLLSGCASPLLAHADDSTGQKKIAVFQLYRRPGYRIENAKGEALRFVSDPDTEQLIWVDGDMDCFMADQPVAEKNTYKTFLALFSKTFTVQNDSAVEEAGRLSSAKSNVDFYLEDGTVVSQETDGQWEKVIHHCNNVIELYGDLSDFTVTFTMKTQATFNIRTNPSDDRLVVRESYNLQGSGKDHVIVALMDGEILTEGMVGNYTVKKHISVGNVSVMQEYDETGKLLSTREE